MIYKDTVISILNNYNFCKNRLDCDNYLFATIGTSYEWHGGQLVKSDYQLIPNSIDEYEDISEAAYTPMFESLYDKNNEKYEDYSYKKDKFLTDENVEFLKRIFEGLKTYDINKKPISRKIKGFRIYPINQSSPILNIPDDIQHDWLEAIEHFVDFCLSHKEILYDDEYDNTNDYTKSLTEKREGWFKDAKKKIVELKK